MTEIPLSPDRSFPAPSPQLPPPAGQTVAAARWEGPRAASEALEVVERKTAALWWTLIAACVLSLVWAALSPLEVVSVADGTVAPSSRLQKVQHLEGGIVSEVLVREGDAVRKDQSLIRLQSTLSHADVKEMDARLTALRGDQYRLEAESTGVRALSLPAAFVRSAPDVAARTQGLFQARRDTLASSLAVQDRQMEEISARLQNTRSRYRLAQEQVSIGVKLLAEGLSNRYEQIEREKEANGLLSRIQEDEAALAKTRSERTAVQNKYDEDVRGALSETRRQLEELTSRETKFRDVATRTDLRAPMDGIVKTLYVNNVGAVVSQGGTVLDLVPVNDTMVIEARLPPQDVGYVAPGQTAMVQLASSDATRFGRIEGKVVQVSPDSVTDTEKKTTYYLVKIETTRSYFESGHARYDLSPGVVVTAGIVTGRRSVLAYLLYPVLRTMPLTLTER